MNRERLEKIRDRLPTLGANFNLINILQTDACTVEDLRKELYNPDCGTTACVIGLLPEIFEEVEYDERNPFYLKIHLKDSGAYGWEVGKTFLQLTANEAIYLFEPSYYHHSELTKPLAVCNRIDELLNGLDVSDEYLVGIYEVCNEL